MMHSLFVFPRKRILITGGCGFIGKSLFYHLDQNPNFDVYALDLSQHGSERIKMDNSSEIYPPIPNEKLFICDIRNILEVTPVISTMDVVVHLAGALENQSLELITQINCIGTKNIIEACKNTKVQKIIFASSALVMWGYRQIEPYASIYAEKPERLPTSIPQILTSAIPRLPTHPPMARNYVAYAESKLYGEELLENFAKISGRTGIVIRFGWVNSLNYPYKSKFSSSWLSIRDAMQLIELAIKNERINFGIYFGVSDNELRWLDIENAREDLGYKPLDRAENCKQIMSKARL